MKEIMNQELEINLATKKTVECLDGQEVSTVEKAVGAVALKTTGLQKVVVAMDDQVRRSWDLHKY